MVLQTEQRKESPRKVDSWAEKLVGVLGDELVVWMVDSMGVHTVAEMVVTLVV
jgi:hypothetical protein